MKTILLLPVFRFGNSLNAITIRTIEIYSRINKKDFNFIINLDKNTYNSIDNYYYNKIKDMDKSFGYAGKNVIKLLKGIISTWKNARKSEYIIGESEYFYSVLYSYFIHVLSRRPLIIIVHHVHPDMYKKNSYVHYAIYKHIFCKVKKILISENEPIIKEFQKNFSRNYRNKMNLLKITYAVDTNSFYTSDEKKYDLLYIGTIEERKNALLLPDIVQKLKKNKQDIKLLIISHRGEIDKLKDIINRKGLVKNVDIISYVTEEEKRRYLAISKIFVFPTKYEGFGMVIAEALASYLPVALFDVPTLRIFSKGVLKAKPFDFNEYINNIAFLLKNNDEIKKLGIEGRKDVEERFDYNAVSQRENNIIKEATF